MPIRSAVVADDEILNRELLAEMLPRFDVQVRTAKDGVQALKALEAEPADLLITDVRMPDMSGFELVEALREDPAMRDIPVIFLTIESESSERGSTLGALEYLTKPISLEALLRKVARHLPPERA